MMFIKKHKVKVYQRKESSIYSKGFDNEIIFTDIYDSKLEASEVGEKLCLKQHGERKEILSNGFKLDPILFYFAIEEINVLDESQI